MTRKTLRRAVLDKAQKKIDLFVKAEEEAKKPKAEGGQNKLETVFGDIERD